MKLSFRIYLQHLDTDAQFAHLKGFLDEHRDLVDELALFTEKGLHGHRSIEELREICSILSERIRQFKVGGYRSVGLNVVSTLGHREHEWDVVQPLPFQPLTAPDGKTSRSCLCPNDPGFRGHLRTKFSMFGATQADFLWIDDDVRLHRQGAVDFPCFCDTCIRRFNEANGTTFDRAALVTTLNSAEGDQYRWLWTVHLEDTMTDLLSLIRDAVRAENPNADLGLMTVRQKDHLYNGNNFEAWFGALGATRGRPGGGAYREARPLDFVYKTLDCARQRAEYPSSVTDVQYEQEGPPYQQLQKSFYAISLENTLAMATGHDGIAFNWARYEPRPLHDYTGLMTTTRAAKPIWQLIETAASGTNNRGLYPALSRLFEARRQVTAADWFTRPTRERVPQGLVLSEIGLPISMDPGLACATVLSGRMAEGYTKQELEQFLSRGVLMDGEVLAHLERVGLSDLCGVRIRSVHTNGVYERFSNDPLNGAGTGDLRDLRMSSYAGNCYAFETLNDSVRTVSDLVHDDGRGLGATLTVFENDRGGRVAVHGYTPWQDIHSRGKRAQLTAVCDWISFGTVPVLVDTYAKVIPFVRSGTNPARFAIVLLNASLERTEPLRVRIRLPIETLYRCDSQGELVQLDVMSSDSGGKTQTVVELDPIDRWDYAVLVPVTWNDVED